MNKIKRVFIWLWQYILRLVYPVRCPFCDEPVPGREMLICAECMTKLRPVRDSYCMKCGKKLDRPEDEFCADCVKYPHLYDRGRSLFVYEEPVKASIYRFKYAGRKEYARAYATLVERELGDFVRSIKPDALVPVPLHRKRYQKRGYNQAELLAGEIGRLVGVPVLRGQVQRVKNTIPLKMLERDRRQNNLKKAFKINGNDVKLNTIIIIDDIYTTGSTMDALSAVLREAGVRRVFFVTLSAGQ
nr:ComF family protein [Lachnospiraceae bacterium]